MENIARGTMDSGYWFHNLRNVFQMNEIISNSNWFQSEPEDGTCIGCKFGHQMALLALVINLAIRCWYHQLELSWYLHHPETHQLSQPNISAELLSLSPKRYARFEGGMLCKVFLEQISSRCVQQLTLAALGQVEVGGRYPFLSVLFNTQLLLHIHFNSEKANWFYIIEDVMGAILRIVNFCVCWFWSWHEKSKPQNYVYMMSLCPNALFLTIPSFSWMSNWETGHG